MFRIRRTFVWPWVLLALLLQVDAVVKSTVMTASTPTPVCGMAGMEMGGGEEMRAVSPASGAKIRSHKLDAHAQCPYCAVAAHAPLAATGALLRPSCAVSFAAFRTASAAGPRGPPTVRPRARGPPLPA